MNTNDHEEIGNVIAGQVSRAGRREWIGLAVIALPFLLYSMDLEVLYLAVPSLTADLEPTSSQLLWITDIYGFLLAGSMRKRLIIPAFPKWSILRLLRHDSDCVHLHQEVGMGKTRDEHPRDSRRVGRLGPSVLERGKASLQRLPLDYIDVPLDDVLGPRAPGLERRPQVPEHLLGLRGHVALTNYLS